MKYIKISLLSLTCLLFSTTNSIQQIKSCDEFRSLLQSAEPTVIYVTAPWCTACTEQMSPVIKAAEQKYAGRVRFCEANYDEHTPICKELGVTGLPRMIFVRKDKPRITLGGSRPQNVFDWNVDEFLKGTLKPDEVVTAPAQKSRAGHSRNR